MSAHATMQARANIASARNLNEINASHSLRQRRFNGTQTQTQSNRKFAYFSRI